MEYGISNLPTLSSDSKFTIFRTAVKGALASCGCPSYHTYLKWAGIVLGISKFTQKKNYCDTIS